MSVEMAETQETETITFRVPKELKEELEDHIWELKTEGELPRDMSRSEYLRNLLQNDIENRGD